MQALHIDDTANPLIRTKIDSRIDLETWSKAIGIKDVALKGQFEFHLVSDGQLSHRSGYDKPQAPDSPLQHPEIRDAFNP